METDHMGFFHTARRARAFHSEATRGPQLQCLSKPVPPTCANARQDIKDCLAFPTGPVNHSNEDHSCHTVKKRAPAGQGTALSRKCIYTAQRSFFTFARSSSLPSAPGKFYHLRGLSAAALTKSLLDHQNRQIVWLCRDAASPGEPSPWLTEGSPAGRGRLGKAAPAEHPLNTLCAPLAGLLPQAV